jgi:ribosome biogenesis GTPase
MIEGLVTKSTGSWYEVRKQNGERIKCRIRGKFKLKGWKLTNPVAVGDKVRFVMEEDGKGLIKETLPRLNYVVRQSPRQKHHLHLLAANVDQAVLVITVVQPDLKQGFIDRFLLMTEPHDIPVIIVINKVDLYSDEDFDICGGLSMIYEDIGYEVILTSAKDNFQIDELQQKLVGKTTLISGQSGVGKSSIINKLLPGQEIETKELSDFSGKGKHTTTFAEMYALEDGGFIIDTPGIKTLSFNNLEVLDVTHNFREFFRKSPDCKFYDCTHRNEPKCAVKNAIEAGEISDLRYTNYLAILDEIEGQNYWERHKYM